VRQRFGVDIDVRPRPRCVRKEWSTRRRNVVQTRLSRQQIPRYADYVSDAPI
jgi:hypothetical protein